MDIFNFLSYGAFFLNLIPLLFFWFMFFFLSLLLCICVFAGLFVCLHLCSFFVQFALVLPIIGYIGGPGGEFFHLDLFSRMPKLVNWFLNMHGNNCSKNTVRRNVYELLLSIWLMKISDIFFLIFIQFVA